MRCAIWYFMYNFKNVKNTHGGVLILVKLQAGAIWYHLYNLVPFVQFKKCEKIPMEER